MEKDISCKHKVFTLILDKVDFITGNTFRGKEDITL